MPRFIVKITLRPDSKKDFSPFFSEVSQDGTMALVSLFVVIVISPCPERGVDTGKCPVVECSSECLDAGVTQRDLSPFSAFSDNRHAAGEFCDFLCGLEAVMTVFAVWPKGWDQFWRQTGANARQPLDCSGCGRLIQNMR